MKSTCIILVLPTSFAFASAQETPAFDGRNWQAPYFPDTLHRPSGRTAM